MSRRDAGQVFHVRHHVAGRDQADHDFARMDADAAHDVADDARPGVFVIGGDLEVLHPLADDGDDGVVPFFPEWRSPSRR